MGGWSGGADWEGRPNREKNAGERSGGPFPSPMMGGRDGDDDDYDDDGDVVVTLAYFLEM